MANPSAAAVWGRLVKGRTGKSGDSAPPDIVNLGSLRLGGTTDSLVFGNSDCYYSGTETLVNEWNFLLLTASDEIMI